MTKRVYHIAYTCINIMYTLLSRIRMLLSPDPSCDIKPYTVWLHHHTTYCSWIDHCMSVVSSCVLFPLCVLYVFKNVGNDIKRYTLGESLYMSPKVNHYTCLPLWDNNEIHSGLRSRGSIRITLGVVPFWMGSGIATRGSTQCTSFIMWISVKSIRYIHTKYIRDGEMWLTCSEYENYVSMHCIYSFQMREPTSSMF